MISWIALAILGLVAFIALVAPGAAIIWALTRDFPLSVGLGPAVTSTIFTLGVISLPQLRLEMTYLLVVLAAGIVLVNALPRNSCWREFCSRSRGSGRDHIYSVVGLLVAALLIGFAMRSASAIPDAILQNHDSLFHLNVIHQISQTGVASPFVAADGIGADMTYPVLFHGFAALISAVASTPFAFNAMVFMVLGILLPVEVLVSSKLLGASPKSSSLALGIYFVSDWIPGYSGFYNAQFPMLLSVALLIGPLMWVIRSSVVRLLTVPNVVLGALLGLGIAFAHPGGAQAFLILACVIGIVTEFIARHEAGRPISRIATLSFWVIPLVVMPFVPALRSMGRYDGIEARPILQSVSQALLLTGPDFSYGIASVVPLLLLASIVIMKSDYREQIVASIITVMLLIFICGTADGFWRAWVGAWWRDSARYAALMMVLAPVAVSLGFDGFMRRNALEGATRGRRIHSAWKAVAVVFGASVLIVGANKAVNWAGAGYDAMRLTHTPWLTPAEYDDMKSIDGKLEAGAVVYGAPQTGVGVLPVVSEYDSRHKTITPLGRDADGYYLSQRFNEIGRNPKVCEIIESQGGSAYYYSDSFVDNLEIYMRYPGYLNVDTSVGFTRVLEMDHAVIWRIDACGE